MSQSELQSRCCSQCGANGHNSRTCSSAGEDSSSVIADGSGAGEIMLFGVRVKVDPMRKSVSMNNLSQYVQPAAIESAKDNIEIAAVAADTGYASADDSVRHQSNAGRERKRGVPWTEDEHKLFLLGLQKVGKGDWRGISRNFVKTRTPTQVASHAQKYFLRRNNLNRRRRRSSLFDITTDSVAGIPMEEKQVQEENQNQPITVPHISPLSGFPMTAFPATVGPVFSPVQIENPMESISSVPPIPVLPTANPSTRPDLNLNQEHETNPSQISLSLSLSYDHNHSSQRVISGFNNGDGIISVA